MYLENNNEHEFTFTDRYLSANVDNIVNDNKDFSRFDVNRIEKDIIKNHFDKNSLSEFNMSESKFKIKKCEKKDNKRGNQLKINKIEKTKVDVNKDENSSMNTLSGHFLSHQQEIILKEKIKKDLPEYIQQIKKKSAIAYKTCEKCRLLVINGYNSSNYSNHK